MYLGTVQDTDKKPTRDRQTAAGTVTGVCVKRSDIACEQLLGPLLLADHIEGLLPCTASHHEMLQDHSVASLVVPCLRHN